MKKMLLLALFLTGCVGGFLGFGKEINSARYKLFISSNDANDITIYLPFPHYKGKPDMRIFKWLKGGFERLRGWGGIYGDEIYKKVEIKLIDTTYGKMLYVYSPIAPLELDTYYAKGSIKEIKLNKDTVLDDYKLTGEDKIKPIKEGPSIYEDYILQEFNMPIYVEFKGKEIYVAIEYEIVVSGSGEFTDSPYFIYKFGNIHKEVDYSNLSFTKFTNSGWHLTPIKKLIGKWVLNKDKK